MQNQSQVHPRPEWDSSFIYQPDSFFVGEAQDPGQLRHIGAETETQLPQHFAPLLPGQICHGIFAEKRPAQVRHDGKNTLVPKGRHRLLL